MRVHVFFFCRHLCVKKREYRTRVRRNRRNDSKNSRKPFERGSIIYQRRILFGDRIKIVSLCLSKCSLFFCFFYLSVSWLCCRTNQPVSRLTLILVACAVSLVICRRRHDDLGRLIFVFSRVAATMSDMSTLIW